MSRKSFKFTLHSDLFNCIPDKIFFPLSRTSGFPTYDLTEKYLTDIIRKNAKKYNLHHISGLSSIRLGSNDLFDIFRIIDDTIFEGVSEDERGDTHGRIHSLFVEPDYNIDNSMSFDSYLENTWIKICELMYKVEGKYLVVNIPPMRFPSAFIDADLTYYHKFIRKLDSRLRDLSKPARENNLRILLNLDPQKLIKLNQENIGNTDEIQNNGSLDSSNENVRYDSFSPFDTFMNFRKFYDSLIENSNGFGLFLDISSYYLFDLKRMSAKIIMTQNEEFPLNNAALLERNLLRNQKLSTKFYDGLQKIEFLKGIGLNDMRWLQIFNKTIQDKKGSLLANDSKFEENFNSMYFQYRMKNLATFGDLPLRSFFFSLRNLNTTTGVPKYFSINSALRVDGFNFETIDWRDIDIHKSDLNPIFKVTIEDYLKERLILHEKQMKVTTDPDTEALDPGLDNISDMKVLSFGEIFNSLKRLYSFF